MRSDDNSNKQERQMNNKFHKPFIKDLLLIVAGTIVAIFIGHAIIDYFFITNFTYTNN